MALSNFILTVAGVSAVILLLRSDVKQSAGIFRRNIRHIRQWLEEESSAASNYPEGLFGSKNTGVLERMDGMGLFLERVCFCPRNGAAEKVKPKELETPIPEKDIPKEKHKD